jgi:hypothetical protein
VTVWTLREKCAQVGGDGGTRGESAFVGMTWWGSESDWGRGGWLRAACACMYVCVCKRVCVHVCMYVCMCVCVCVHGTCVQWCPAYHEADGAICMPIFYAHDI